MKFTRETPCQQQVQVEDIKVIRVREFNQGCFTCGGWNVLTKCLISDNEKHA